MKKQSAPFINGIILAAVFVLFIIYFSVNSSWGVAQIAIVLLIVLLSVFQFFIYFKFLKK